MKNIAIFGAGMLGKYLYKYFQKFNKNLYNVTLYSHNELDITDTESVENIIKQNNYIINCAAYTNVDKAETEIDLCMDVNGMCLQNIARFCNVYNVKLIHISTDFVYGYVKTKGFNQELLETDELNPINVYGISKQLGELNIINKMTQDYLILRVSWLFGPDNANFISKIVDKIKDNNIPNFSVVNDQFGRPTSVYLIKNIIYEYINDFIPDGIYNLQNDGEIINKFQLAQFINDNLNMHKKIYQTTSNEFPSPAKRQFNSIFSCKKLDSIRENKRQTWQEDVLIYLNTICPTLIKKPLKDKIKDFLNNLFK